MLVAPNVGSIEHLYPLFIHLIKMFTYSSCSEKSNQPTSQPKAIEIHSVVLVQICSRNEND
jgi:hypothetical protein